MLTIGNVSLDSQKGGHQCNKTSMCKISIEWVNTIVLVQISEPTGVPLGLSDPLIKFF